MFIQTEPTPEPGHPQVPARAARARQRHARHARQGRRPRSRRSPSGCSRSTACPGCSSAPISSPSPRRTANGSSSSPRSSAPSWNISCRARRWCATRPVPPPKRGGRVLRGQGCRDGGHHQGADRDPGASGGRQRWRRHHLPRLQGGRRLSRHEGRLLGLPVLDRDAAARHPEPAAPLRSGRGRGPADG